MPKRLDDRYTSGDVGEVLLGVRMDTAGTIAGADLDYTPAQFDARGNLRQAPMLSNGATEDPQRNNTEVTVFASAARTATANSADQTNHNARGVRLFLDITAVGGTSPTLDVKLQGKCPVSAAYIDIPGAVFAQQTGVVSLDLVVYPGAVATANRSVSSIIPRTWRVVGTLGGSDTPTVTYSLGASYVI